MESSIDAVLHKRGINNAMESAGLQGWHEACRGQMKFCGVEWTCLALYRSSLAMAKHNTSIKDGLST